MKKDLNKPVSRARHFSETAIRGSETIVENLAKYFLNARTVGIKFDPSFQNNLIGKKSVGKKFRWQKISSVINIRHLDKNSSLFTDEIFCWAIYETYYKTLTFPVFL